MDLKILHFRFLYLILLFFVSAKTLSQCFEIQSILVDACGGTDEGRNEMARFKVGNAPLNINNLVVTWPNNSWQGVVQNSTTATKVAELNTAIITAGGCGQILEPPGGILPSGATAILVTSFNMNTAANAFGPISENIYMVFQNNASNNIGHFANFGPPPGARTFSMTFGAGCTDTVIYDRTQLTDTNGNRVAADGATVNFTPAGIATYTNTGCEAPTPPFTVDAGPLTLTSCAGATINLNAIAQGQQSLLWSASTGSFSSPTAATTQYTIPLTAGGSNVVLTIEATNICGHKVSDVINLSVTPSTTPNFATALTLCTTDTAPILASVSPNGISGTWNPSVINTNTNGNYVFTPNAGQCAATANLTVTINPEIIPDFTTSLTLCTTDTAPILSSVSPNGISGTWNPSVINTNTNGNYIFTPNAGQCAATANLTVTISPEIIPDFTTSLTLCTTDTAPILASVSPNGISGTWNPSVINTNTNGNYVFTPNAGQCASTANLTVTINPEIIPDFATSLTLCTTETPPILASVSPNGISGTWNPSVINTNANGNYVFTPNVGQCASTANLTVTINPEIIPDFTTSLTLCTTDAAPILASVSPNGISGTWNPSVINTNANGNYVFTPNVGQCAATANLAVTINPEIIPDFATALTLCTTDAAPILASISPNGISGTWNPSVINTNANGNYIFTPNVGQCASTANLAVTINPEIIPDFAASLTLCTTDAAPILASVSPNGISGTWNPSVINTNINGNYIFTPNVGQCASTANLTVTINPEIIPDFTTALTLCTTDTAPILASVSPNGISGTWNPSVINTNANGNYIFTPNSGQCASTTNLAVTINPEIIPDFTTSLTLCTTETPPILASVSPNGISGTWNPSIINTNANGNYVFTPNVGQCASTANLTVTINPEIIPDFMTSLTLCTTDTAPILASVSPNGISGTWNPSVINTNANGNYVFTPNVGQCASTANLAVTINPEIIPDFMTSLTLCTTDTAPILASVSPNGISGTWNPSVINTNANGNYIFTPNVGQCASTANLAVTINPEIIPDFTTSLTLCTTDAAPILASVSPNGISGTWNPSVINTNTNGNYVFTPNAGQCAATANLTVTINPEIIPDFATSLTLCTTDTAPILASVSPNGISGTWNPSVINTNTNGNYVFTPNAGQCAATANLAVTINPEIIPDFATLLTLCTTDTAPILASVSPNGISGTWNPSVINTNANGNYVFTPNAGQCAATANLAVTINPEIIPDFMTALTLCTTDVAPILATTSPNGISGTWNPSVINTNTNGNYVFTPNAGQCAATTNLAVTINPEIIPDFATSLTLCTTDTAPILATTSPNGITGTWNPSVINTNANGNYVFTPNAGQCASISNLAVTINPEIIPDFATSLTLCTTDTAPTLASVSPNGITGTWNPSVINTNANGNYVFTPNPGQCATATNLAVEISSFTFSVKQECTDNVYLIKVITNSDLHSSDYNYTWHDDNGIQIQSNNSTFNFSEYIDRLQNKPNFPVQFKVTVSHQSCEIEEVFEVTNNLCGIPNAISPNGDGVNDSFDLSSLGVNNLSIFNRYGREVYHFSGKYENQWNGQWQDGKLPMGTYYYIISNENGDQKAGWVFLVY